MNKNLWDKPQNNQYNTIIVGAGITGLSIAYHLKKRNPKERILICDKDINRVASRRNAGFLTSGSLEYLLKLIPKHGYEKALKIWAIAKTNRRMVLNFLQNNNASGLVDLNNLGSTTFVNKNEIEKIDVLRKFGFTDRLESIFRNDDYVALFDQDESSFNPLRFHEILLSIVKLMGVEVCFDFEIETIKRDKKAWFLNNGLKTKKLFLATNTSKFTKEVFKKDQNITRARAQIQAYNLSFKTASTSNIYIPSNKLYFRVINNKLIIGGLRDIDKDSEFTEDLGLNDLIQKALKDFVINNIDSGAKLINQWSGIMGLTDKDIPSVDISFKKSVYAIGGYSGHGNGFAFYLSKLMVDSVVSNEISEELKIFMD